MTRPVWELMNRLPMFEHCETDGLENTEWLADRVVNIPSSVRLDKMKKIAVVHWCTFRVWTATLGDR